MANVKIQLPELEVSKVNYKIEIVSTAKAKIGELHFSKGSVEWWPKGNYVNAISFSWKDLATALETSDKGKAVQKQKKAAKKKAAPSEANSAAPRKRKATTA